MAGLDELVENSSLVLTCEHGGHTIPREFRAAFADAGEALSSHRGYDPGALEMAQALKSAFKAPLFFEKRSRLLIELNRSVGHPRLFSEFSQRLSEEVREGLLQTIYRPYRTSVQQEIERRCQSGSVFHLSVHSFTPVMNGKVRKTDIGLLFDPSRPFESELCKIWKQKLKRANPDLAVHFNRPYRGTSDGFTTELRTQFEDAQYAGVELEVNQKFALEGGERWKNTLSVIRESLRELLPRR